jgi:hypothetical protein
MPQDRGTSLPLDGASRDREWRYQKNRLSRWKR